MTVTPANGTPYPQWMELTLTGDKIEGRVQPRGGAWRPIVGAKVESGKLVVAVSAAGRGPAINWELTSTSADKLNGVEKRGDTDGPSLVGVRAPNLDRPMPKKWSKPQPLFNGKDLTGWEPIGNVTNNKWVARDGELVNDNPEVQDQRGPGGLASRDGGRIGSTQFIVVLGGEWVPDGNPPSESRELSASVDRPARDWDPTRPIASDHC